MREDDLDIAQIRCCACEACGARNVMMLPRCGPTPGKGWGCFLCDLPMDGAIAVLCDACLETNAEPKFVVVGFLASGERMPIDKLPEEVFEHDQHIHELHELATSPREMS